MWGWEEENDLSKGGIINKNFTLGEIIQKCWAKTSHLESKNIDLRFAATFLIITRVLKVYEKEMWGKEKEL